MVCVALRCLLRVGQTKRITAGIMQRLLEKKIAPVTRCVLVIATSQIELSNSDVTVEMIDFVLQNCSRSDITSDFVVMACRVKEIAEHILRKIDNEDVQLSELDALRVLLMAVRHRELWGVVQGIIGKTEFENYQREIECVKSLIEK